MFSIFLLLIITVICLSVIFANKHLSNNSDENNSKILPLVQGKELSKSDSYLVILHEHPEYGLVENDFVSHPNFGKCSNNDIAWGIFNKRSLMHITDWKFQEQNYSNMLTLLIEEKRYINALDILFIVSYFETSGCIDDDYLNYINKGYNKEEIPINNQMFKIDNYKVTKNFYIIQDNLNLNFETIRNKYINSEALEGLQSMQLPQYFDIQQSYELFMQAIANKSFSGYYIPKIDCFTYSNYINFNEITRRIYDLQLQFMNSFSKRDLLSVKQICNDLIKIEPITNNHFKIFHDTINYIENHIYPLRKVNIEYEYIFIELCEKDIKYFNKLSIIENIENSKIVNLTRLCVIFENKNMINEAIKLCDIGMQYNIIDTNNKSFENRKNRLLKKLI